MPDLLRVAAKNFLWPAIYAVVAAVAAQVAAMASGQEPFDATSLALSGGAALLAFVSSRLNPYAGRDEPIIEPLDR